MSKAIIICLGLAIAAVSISVPCVSYQTSKNGNASDCSINRLDDNTLEWGANINFNVDFTWKADSYSNLLADMGSPRLPIFADSSKCTTKEGKYSKGQSVLVNCTQSFSSIPVGYSNVVSAFDGDDYPLGFSTKVPLSSPNLSSE
jgi:hypothetical protein